MQLSTVRARDTQRINCCILTNNYVEINNNIASGIQQLKGVWCHWFSVVLVL